MSTAVKNSSVPQWLREAYSVDHLPSVLPILSQRENIREEARSASRHQSNPSRTHRLVHLPSALIKNSSEDIDHYSISVACQPENRKLNRYADVEPYDRTRVVVGHGGEESEEPGARYLNASWVRELFGGKWWIATQAPLPGTTHAFLSVLLQPVSSPPSDLHPLPRPQNYKTSRIRTVVQLTKDIERGIRKAHVYFPPIEGEGWLVSPEEDCSAPPFRVTLLKVEEIEEAHCTLSTVSIQSTKPIIPSPSATEAAGGPRYENVGEPVVFRHMLYSSWPDHGVPEPEDRAALFHFIHLVDKTNRDISSQPPESQADLDPDPPIIVNCSAGIGRTGSFIAVSSLLRSNGFLPPCTSSMVTSGELPELSPSPLGEFPEEFKQDLVCREIDSLREQRPGMVQRRDQVLLVYEMLIAAFLGEDHQKSSGKD